MNAGALEPRPIPAAARAAAGDTIAAIATPPGRGGIGVVRVSGTGIEALVEGLLGLVPEPRCATLATFRAGNGDPLDEGLALWFPAPASYTGESVLELQGHGSPAALRLLLARCLELGARVAQPGEFTQRAFLNGKLDLAQAESVADLIDAATGKAARAAARSLTGEFSREIGALVGAITELRMFTEATLDFPEEDIEFVRAADAAGKLASIRARLDRLLHRAQGGARLAQGLVVVLVGRPNVGKSSLLNRLVREDAAIVTPVPGTTRDTVERVAEVGGIPLTFVDTAGLRDTEDAVERIGIERSHAAIGRADCVMVLVDAREARAGLEPEDRAIVDRLPPGLPRIVVHNKADLLDGDVPVGRVERGGATHVWLSALTGEGVAALEAVLLSVAGVDAEAEDTFIARARHLEALRLAGRHLAEAEVHLGASPGPEPAAEPALELFAEELRLAQQALGAITGEFTADDLLGVIFSRFCIGK